MALSQRLGQDLCAETQHLGLCACTGVACSQDSGSSSARGVHPLQRLQNQQILGSHGDRPCLEQAISTQSVPPENSKPRNASETRATESSFPRIVRCRAGESGKMNKIPKLPWGSKALHEPSNTTPCKHTNNQTTHFVLLLLLRPSKPKNPATQKKKKKERQLWILVSQQRNPHHQHPTTPTHNTTHRSLLDRNQSHTQKKNLQLFR